MRECVGSIGVILWDWWCLYHIMLYGKKMISFIPTISPFIPSLTCLRSLSSFACLDLLTVLLVLTHGRWTTYEHTKKVSPFREPFAQAALGAAAATTITTLACHPLDMLKTRYQVSTSNTIASLDAAAGAATASTAKIRKEALTRSDDHKGIKYVVRNVLREAGWRGLYLGLVPRLVCSVPGSLITMSVFEYYNPDKSSESEYAHGGALQEEALGT